MEGEKAVEVKSKCWCEGKECEIAVCKFRWATGRGFLSSTVSVVRFEQLPNGGSQKPNSFQVIWVDLGIRLCSGGCGVRILIW